MKLNLKKGFTLIELVVVIAILGILAGIAIPRFLDATATARGAKIVADLRTIDSALAIYNAKEGYYPQIMPFGDSSALTTDDPANHKHKLLASWPVPPSGTIIFPCNPNKKIEVASGHATYFCAAAYGRAMVAINSTSHMYTADQLAEGGDAY
jgi:prepilin-type N-terminal cleavage/methylation domain-containing protein